jgi:hypothetical protein
MACAMARSARVLGLRRRERKFARRGARARPERLHRIARGRGNIGRVGETEGVRCGHGGRIRVEEHCASSRRPRQPGWGGQSASGLGQRCLGIWGVAMPDLTQLALYFAAALVLAVTPGPGLFYVAARTLAGGRSEGVASSFGTGLGGMSTCLRAAWAFPPSCSRARNSSRR